MFSVIRCKKVKELCFRRCRVDSGLNLPRFCFAVPFN
uniref:Uncharacterized protein n=1 Tax=Rhizophora mucronata TaxID=61149 RepID=A0A2P2P3C9_RHIMU